MQAQAGFPGWERDATSGICCQCRLLMCLKMLMGCSHLQTSMAPVNLKNEILNKPGKMLDFPFVYTGQDIIRQC